MLKEQLKTALESIAKGDVEAAASVAEQLKQLPRTEEGLFDTSAIDGNLFEAARWVYPVYAAYETECNKKEDYPDLLNQMRLLDMRYGKNTAGQESARFLDTACYLDALIHTIDNVTPQLYEYYRELADNFKARVKEVVEKFYHYGSFSAPDGSAQEEAEKLIRGAIGRACRTHVLLAEKYQQYC